LKAAESGVALIGVEEYALTSHHISRTN